MGIAELNNAEIFYFTCFIYTFSSNFVHISTILFQFSSDWSMFVISRKKLFDRSYACKNKTNSTISAVKCVRPFHFKYLFVYVRFSTFFLIHRWLATGKRTFSCKNSCVPLESALCTLYYDANPAFVINWSVVSPSSSCGFTRNRNRFVNPGWQAFHKS